MTFFLQEYLISLYQDSHQIQLVEIQKHFCKIYYQNFKIPINILHQHLFFKTTKTIELTEFRIGLINIFTRILILLNNGKVQGEFIDFFLGYDCDKNI